MKSTIANRYALGLFKIAEENNLVDKITEDCLFLMEVFNSTPELQKILENPKISKEDKFNLINQGLKESLHHYTIDFIALMVEKGRASQLKDSLARYVTLAEKAKGLINVEVTSAVELEGEQIQRLRKGLVKMTGKEVNIKNFTDPSILGGLIIKIGNKVIDGSIKNQIDKIKNSLLKVQVMEVEVRE
ncbi:ATP synthase F1 subcomplex delta subunit [Anaerobranca californiensis DSM 14826]|jgi:F-type H+-transporting ATPase subunit delta|uniref:ATP synthase subunit delta n=1 Tax=Anaerobranca californiensis DSM 14826 TaxID=1120989 RepID=A0A1M6MB92_9FIRM|nr:ATP synthase F1 subunit delta [Anaerobranca californiensis]SHJ80640.1 ATP synthase F1 subcomplex delta subunit [Anaerobranca californiensis DSM 14826]